MKGYKSMASGGHLGPMSREGSLAGLICCGMGSQLLWSDPKVRFFYDRKWYRGYILTLIYILTMMTINSFYCFKIIFFYWIVLLFLANSAYVVAIKIKSVLRKSASTNISPTYTVNIISELLNDYQFLVLVLIKLTLKWYNFFCFLYKLYKVWMLNYVNYKNICCIPLDFVFYTMLIFLWYPLLCDVGNFSEHDLT